MAVYTEVSDSDLAHFVQTYDLGEVVSCKGIAEGVENSNFLLRTERGLYILTLYEKRVREDDLPFFLGLMEHLAARGVAAPTPLRDRDGQSLRHLAGRPAAIVTFLDGMWPRRIEPFHCGALGEALARFHLAGLDYTRVRANALAISSWRALLEASRSRADEVQVGLAAELSGVLTDLERRWPANLPQGVIHADLFPDNVFFRGEQLTGLIDFYFACNDGLAYDLAICLNAWCFEPDRSFNVTKAKRLLARYRAIRPLDAVELAALPVLAEGAALRFLLTRLYDWLHTPPGAMVTKKDPLEYYEKLKFHRRVRGPSEYGLS
jgi:homoserine kinase type II